MTKAYGFRPLVRAVVVVLLFVPLVLEDVLDVLRTLEDDRLRVLVLV